MGQIPDACCIRPGPMRRPWRSTSHPPWDDDRDSRVAVRKANQPVSGSAAVPATSIPNTLSQRRARIHRPAARGAVVVRRRWVARFRNLNGLMGGIPRRRGEGKILHRIDRLVADANLEMQVGTAGIAGRADRTELLACADCRAWSDTSRDGRQVRVARQYPLAAAQVDDIAVVGVAPGVDHYAGRGCPDRRSICGRKVNATMKSIVTRPELGSDTREPIEWPDHVRVRRPGGPGWCGSTFGDQGSGKEQYETEHGRLLSRPNCARLPAWQKMTELKGW